MRSHSSHRERVDIDAVGDRVYAGIVDEDVEPPESAQRRLERALDLRSIADIHRHGDALGSVAANAFAVSKSISAIITAAPLAAKVVAIARPMPFAAPVTNATWPLRSHLTAILRAG